MKFKIILIFFLAATICTASANAISSKERLKCVGEFTTLAIPGEPWIKTVEAVRFTVSLKELVRGNGVTHWIDSSQLPGVNFGGVLSFGVDSGTWGRFNTSSDYRIPENLYLSIGHGPDKENSYITSNLVLPLKSKEFEIFTISGNAGVIEIHLACSSTL